MSEREKRKWNRTHTVALSLAILVGFIWLGFGHFQKVQTEKLINQNIAAEMAKTYEALSLAKIVGPTADGSKLLLEADGALLDVPFPTRPWKNYHIGQEVSVIEVRRQFDGSLVRRYISTQLGHRDLKSNSILDPANPISPLFPMSPTHPTSPMNPQSPANPFFRR